MTDNINVRALAVAFIIGLIAPFMLSVVAMLISFDAGVMLAKVLVPLSSVGGLSDAVITGLNGILYAIIAGLIMILRR